MKNEAVKILQKKKKTILEQWSTNQLSNDGLRDDLISNEDQLAQSDELLSAFLNALTEENLDDTTSSDFEKVIDILSGISISRAKQGFSSQETGVYIFSLKDALLTVLQQE